MSRVSTSRPAVIVLIVLACVGFVIHGTGQVAADGSENFLNPFTGLASVYQATTAVTSTVTTTTTSTTTSLTSTTQTSSTSTTQTSSTTSTTTSLTSTSQTPSTITVTTTSTTTSLSSTTQTSSTSTTETSSTTSTTTSLTSTTLSTGTSQTSSTSTATTTTTSTTTSLSSTTQTSSATTTFIYPSLLVNPSAGLIGSTVGVSGSGFSTSDTSCSISGMVVASSTCSISGGALTGTFTVATVGIGSYTVTATGNQAGDSAAATFTVPTTTGPAIPGFPVEAILAGLLLGTIIIALLRRRPIFNHSGIAHHSHVSELDRR